MQKAIPDYKVIKDDLPHPISLICAHASANEQAHKRMRTSMPVHMNTRTHMCTHSTMHAWAHTQTRTGICTHKHMQMHIEHTLLSTHIATINAIK